jgi:ribosome-associated toxin RatA of RatAB toxin-antitoxin module
VTRSTIGIDIAAPPDLVFRITHDVERWERLLPHYTRSRVRNLGADGSVVADFVARRTFVGILGLGWPVTWRSRTWSEPEARRLRFIHVAGATRGMDVTWRIDPTPDGCRVEIEHDFSPRIPGFAPFVDRIFIRPIAGRTLTTFKALAEALTEAPGAEPGAEPAGNPDSRESDTAATTNPSA